MRNGFGIILGLWVLALGGYIYWQNSLYATESFVGEDAEEEMIAEAIAAEEEHEDIVQGEDKFIIVDKTVPDPELLETAENREWADVQIAIDWEHWVKGKARYIGERNYEIMRNDIDSEPIDVKKAIINNELEMDDGAKFKVGAWIAYRFDDYYIQAAVVKGTMSYKRDENGNAIKNTLEMKMERKVTKETYSK